ncbi:SHOCT domain-containing protein [Pseudactinotalea sp.]|uniref:SHOCT domain-containing protein n=1 Tax=Pseudactinotalea sp. TaxID=1926260 RepID=UPI003B3A2124
MLDFFASFWDFLVSMLLIFVWVGALIALFTVITDLFRDSGLPTWQKVVWFIALLFLPFLGSLIYLSARGKGMAERSAARASAVQAAQQEYIREAAGTSASPAAEIERAKALLDAGTISEQEYASLKAKALA